MSWASFCQTYERSGGALRLGQWSQTGGTYQATLTIGECIESSTVSACGPMAALTAMLSERGIRMETLSFHQLRDGDQTCTFIRGTNGRHRLGHGPRSRRHHVLTQGGHRLRQPSGALTPALSARGAG